MFSAVSSLAQGSGKSEATVPGFQTISRLLPLNKKNIVRSHFLGLAPIQFLFLSRSPGNRRPLLNVVCVPPLLLLEHAPYVLILNGILQTSHGMGVPTFVTSQSTRSRKGEGFASTWFSSHLRCAYVGRDRTGKRRQDDMTL